MNWSVIAKAMNSLGREQAMGIPVNFSERVIARVKNGEHLQIAPTESGSDDLLAPPAIPLSVGQRRKGSVTAPELSDLDNDLAGEPARDPHPVLAPHLDPSQARHEPED
jgi:hypothetical protein